MKSVGQRPTRVEIDLEAIAYNFNQLKTLGKEIICVLKADAYGHGAVPVAQCLRDQGARHFAVALHEEGIELRNAGIKENILILNGAYGDSHKEVLEHGLTPVIYSFEHLKAFEAACGHHSYRVHIKIDTGMHRLGLPLGELPKIVDALTSSPTCKVEGIFTHLSSSDHDRTHTLDQLDQFNQALRLFETAQIQPPFIHAANSGGTCLIAESHFNTIRPGAYLYGITPTSWFGSTKSILPSPKVAMRFRSEIIAIRALEPGEAVGYDRTHIVSRTTHVATLPVGYADGISRAFGNLGQVWIHGKPAPILGRVSMDLITVDVTNMLASVGDEAIFLGPLSFSSNATHVVHPDDVAQTVGTIGYELVTSVSKRVPRIYRWAE